MAWFSLFNFKNTHIRKSAILTACKNISNIERLEDGYVWANSIYRASHQKSPLWVFG